MSSYISDKIEQSKIVLSESEGGLEEAIGRREEGRRMDET